MNIFINNQIISYLEPFILTFAYIYNGLIFLALYSQQIARCFRNPRLLNSSCHYLCLWEKATHKYLEYLWIMEENIDQTVKSIRWLSMNAEILSILELVHKCYIIHLDYICGNFSMSNYFPPNTKDVPSIPDDICSKRIQA